MKEKDLLNIIKTTLNSKLIGDDCAYLKDLGIVITQDSLVEGVHFSREFATPFQLGYKSAMVNISDVCASGAEPKYLTVALSLPDDITQDFIKEFYEGLKSACKNVEIAGGDITGSDKIFISVTAIGAVKQRRISSRSNAKVGQKIIVSGEHGSSGAGLRLLQQQTSVEKLPSFERTAYAEKFINAHLMPKAQIDFSEKIALNIQEDYAMMDSSDGFLDALSQIAEASGVQMEIDFEKIPFDDDLKIFSDYKELIFYSGEDYGLIATVDEELSKKFTIIGEVKTGAGVKVNYSDKTELFSKSEIEQKLFNHFEDSSKPTSFL